MQQEFSMTQSEIQQFTPVWPHGEIREIFKNIFFVTGTNKVHYAGDDIQTSRNMIIIRDGTQLTLINTVRLDEDGLQKLDSLVDVTHIFRIGAFHGRDDAFYKNQYPTSILWNLKGMSYESGLKADQDLIPGSTMPIPDCSLFAFETSKFPEGVLHIAKEGGILITCDSIQNITCTDDFYSATTARSLHAQGLIQPANISPIWLSATHTSAEDFYRLLKTMTFDHLLTAHGEPLINTAFAQVTQTVKRVFS